MRQSRRTEGTYQKPKKQTVAFASTKKADSTRLRFVTHLHPRFRLSCNHYTQENLFRKDKEKQKSNICSCFYFFLLHLPLQSCIYFFIQRPLLFQTYPLWQSAFISAIHQSNNRRIITPMHHLIGIQSELLRLIEGGASCFNHQCFEKGEPNQSLTRCPQAYLRLVPSLVSYDI